MYLSQMAEIPLLTREQEISLAKKIEVTRKRFRRTVHRLRWRCRPRSTRWTRFTPARLPFDRTIKVSLTERLTKEQIMARMPHNLATLKHMSDENRKDFSRLVNRRTSAEARAEARKRLFAAAARC